MKRTEEHQFPNSIHSPFVFPPPLVLPDALQVMLNQENSHHPILPFASANPGISTAQQNNENNFYQGLGEQSNDSFSRHMAPRMGSQHTQGNSHYGQQSNGQFYGPNGTTHHNLQCDDSGHWHHNDSHQKQWKNHEIFEVPQSQHNIVQQSLSIPHMTPEVSLTSPSPVMATPEQTPVPPIQQHKTKTLHCAVSPHQAATMSKVKKKKKRRPMSEKSAGPWNEQDAKQALLEEKKYSHSGQKQRLVIHFPDAIINKEDVKQFHESIEHVNFVGPNCPRYCIVELKNSSDVEKTIHDLQCISFNGSYLKVEKIEKKLTLEEKVNPKDIDPYTLYIGNISLKVTSHIIKEKFPTAAKIDIGVAQRMKSTRYAFIRFNNVNESIQAYRNSQHLLLDSRSIITRFRRIQSKTGPPGEPEPRKTRKENDKKNHSPLEEKSYQELSEKVKDLEKRLKMLMERKENSEKEKQKEEEYENEKNDVCEDNEVSEDYNNDIEYDDFEDDEDDDDEDPYILLSEMKRAKDLDFSFY